MTVASRENRLAKVCGYLNDRELFYAVTGAWALRAHNVRKGVAEGNFDFLLNATPEDWRALQRFLLHEGFTLVAQDLAWHRYRDKNGDLYRLARAEDPYDLATIGRRQVSSHDYTTVFVAGPEDLILRCLAAKRKDAVELAAAVYRGWRDYLDLTYLIGRSRQLGVYRTFLRVKKREDGL